MFVLPDYCTDIYNIAKQNRVLKVTRAKPDFAGI